MTCIRLLSLLSLACLLSTSALIAPGVYAQEESDEERIEESEEVVAPEAGPGRSTIVDRTISFDAGNSTVPDGVEVLEYLWDFGDNVRTTGQTVSHAYTKPGKYTVRLTVTTADGQRDDTTEIRVFDRLMLLLTDSSINDEELEVFQRQAAEESIFLLTLSAKTGGPEALVEEELTQLLATAREDVGNASLIITWTSGGIGANVLSRFAQQVRQADEFSLTDLDITNKGVLLLSETPFGLISPTAQATFDQLLPSFVLLTRPAALPLLFNTATAEEARLAIVNSPIEYRLLGSFSSRAISDIGVTNFMSFGINYLINGGVPINNIVLILIIPVIATILSFARQVVGIKAFGIVTPAMTTLSFLVLGLSLGLLVFIVVLLSGSITRFLLRRFHLLYLPRMALVLTVTSLAVLVLLGVGAAFGNTTTLSFSIFPILILNILAEEFIAVQFSRGQRTAMRITMWTLILAVLCYFIVSWQPLRTLLLSYPELILLAIPINVLLGRFTGLRLVEYVRFRELLRYGPK